MRLYERNNCKRILSKNYRVVVSSKIFWNFVKSFLMNAALRKMEMSLMKMVKPYFRRMLFSDLQKQSFTDVLQNRFSGKFRRFHRKTPVLEYLFNKVTGLKAGNFIKKRPQHRCFLVNIAENF